MKAAYVSSLALMLNSLHAAGIRTSYVNVDAAHIADQRDTLAHLALKSDATHVLFIDSDMRFSVDLAEKLLAFGEPFVGAIYAMRKLDLDKVGDALTQQTNFKRAFAAGHDFVVQFESAQLQRRGEFFEVRGIGLGFALVARQVFEIMASRLDLARYPGRYVSGDMVGYFREMIADSGQRVSEDLSFCRRWRDCGGKIWGHGFADIKHVGDFAYGMPFASLFEPKA